MPVFSGALDAQLLPPSPCPVLVAGCSPHRLALLGTPGLPLWVTTVLGMDMLCQEHGEGLVGPTWQRHALERGWDLHCLRWDPACLEKPSFLTWGSWVSPACARSWG